MSREQIEEMAKSICGLNTIDGCFCDGGYCNYNCLAYEKATTLYNAGCRKQSVREWISVDERLPERNGRYLTHCNVEGQSLVCVLYYCKIGGFNEGTVTHWMPLPEPPMKGGAE